MHAKYLLLATTLISCLLSCKGQTSASPKESASDTLYTFRKASSDGIGKFYKNREIAHVMGAAGSEWLERNDRQKEENTELAIQKMNLFTGMVVADIGAGTGYYSFKIAKQLTSGKVYAVEIQDEMIDYLHNKKNSIKDSIVEIIKSTSKSVQLPDNCVDLALMVDVYHELEFPVEILQSIHSALKPGGILLLIEYRAEDPAILIKPLHKTSVKQLNKELTANGFQLYSDGEFLPIQHFLMYRK